MRSTIRKVSTLTAVLLAFSTVGMASLFSPNATFGFIPLGNLTISPGNDLLAATTITLPSNELINTVPPTAFGLANDFDGIVVPGSLTALNPLTLNLAGPSIALPGLLQFPGSNRFTFNAASEVISSSSVTRSVSIFLLGTFHDSNPAGFTDAPASVTFSFSQSAPNSTINGSATFSSPPQGVTASGVPEPASMFLLSSALIGLGMIGRKRLAR